MKTTIRHSYIIQGGILAVTTALLMISLSSVSCGGQGEETFDNIDSRINCREYCVKKADCNDEQASNDETQACVDDCRDSIEDRCGNDHQAAANDKIGECVDMTCNEFWICMTFDVAPECFGFVED